MNKIIHVKQRLKLLIVHKDEKSKDINTLISFFADLQVSKMYTSTTLTPPPPNTTTTTPLVIQVFYIQ